MISKINTMGNYYVPGNNNKKQKNNILISNNAKQVSFEGANVGTLSKLNKHKTALSLGMLATLFAPSILKAKDMDTQQHKNMKDVAAHMVLSTINPPTYLSLMTAKGIAEAVKDYKEQKQDNNLIKPEETGNTKIVENVISKEPVNIKDNNLQAEGLPEKSVITEVIHTSDNQTHIAGNMATKKIEDAAKGRLNKILDKMYEETNEKYQEQLKNFNPKIINRLTWSSIIVIGTEGIAAGAIAYFFPPSIPWIAKAAPWVIKGTAGAIAFLGGEKAYSQAKEINQSQVQLVKIKETQYLANSNGASLPVEEKMKLFPDATWIEKLAKIVGGVNPLEVTSGISKEELAENAIKVFPNNDGKLSQAMIIIPDKKDNLSNANIHAIFVEMDSKKFDGMKEDNGSYNGITEVSFEIPKGYAEFMEDYMNIDMVGKKGSITVEGLEHLKKLADAMSKNNGKKIGELLDANGDKKINPRDEKAWDLKEIMEKDDEKKLSQLDWNWMNCRPFFDNDDDVCSTMDIDYSKTVDNIDKKLYMTNGHGKNYDTLDLNKDGESNNIDKNLQRKAIKGLATTVHEFEIKPGELRKAYHDNPKTAQEIQKMYEQIFNLY